MNIGFWNVILILLISVILANSVIIITYTYTAKRNKRMMNDVEKIASSLKNLKI